MEHPATADRPTGPRVAYVTGGWASNIGNAYYNLGMLHALRRVFGEANVFAVPDVAAWVWSVEDNFEPLRHLDVDLLLLSGPTLAAGMEDRYRSVFDALVERGGRFGFVSAGAAAYTGEERDTVLRFLARYPGRVAGLATRDSDTYGLYRDADFPVHDGICGSMFLDEAVRVPDLDHEPYVVFNFPRAEEPRLRLRDDGSVRVRRRLLARRLPGRVQRELAGMPVIRTQSNPYNRDPRRTFDRPRMFYWDTPEGFLAIYKNARMVFSERVHTCASTLVLGGTAMYVPGSARSRDNRNALFQRLRLDDIYQRPVRLDRSFLEGEKAELLRFLRDEVGG